MTLKDLEDAIEKTKEYFKVDSNSIEVTLWVDDKQYIVKGLSRFHIMPEFTIHLQPKEKQ